MSDVDPDLVERRNFRLNAAEGGLFIAATAFISAQTVLPALVLRLGGTNLVIGVLGVIGYFGLFLPQLFAARYVQTLSWKKPWALGFGLALRLCILPMALCVFLWGVDQPARALMLFLIVYGIMTVLNGFSTPGWYDMYAKLTPLKKRGRLSGIRVSIGGAGSFVAGLMLTWILATVSFPVNFVLAMLVAWGVQMVSWVIQSRLVELAPSKVAPRKSLGAYFLELRDVLKTNHDFRRFLWSVACLVVATMPISFFTVFALKEFHADEKVVGEFTLLMMAVQVISALANGYIADRWGNKVALMTAAIALLLASVTAFVAPSLGTYYFVFVFLGAYIGTELITRLNMSIEFGRIEQRSIYVGLMNTLLAPLYIVGIVGGILGDLFGHRVVFAVGIVFSVFGVLLLHFRVRDPRFSLNRP